MLLWIRRRSRRSASSRLLGRIGALRGLQSAIEFDLNKLRVFQQSHDFDPHDFIEEVLTHRPVVADGAGKPPIFV